MWGTGKLDFGSQYFNMFKYIGYICSLYNIYQYWIEMYISKHILTNNNTGLQVYRFTGLHV